MVLEGLAALPRGMWKLLSSWPIRVLQHICSFAPEANGASTLPSLSPDANERRCPACLCRRAGSSAQPQMHNDRQLPLEAAEPSKAKTFRASTSAAAPPKQNRQDGALCGHAC